jgi:ribosomal protein L11 methylase PrmA
MLASGIFVDREVEVRDAFEAAGLVVTATTREGEWVAIDAYNRAASSA